MVSPCIAIQNVLREKIKNPRYYYYCKNTSTATGHKCDFRTNIEQSQINDFVAGVISAMVHDSQFETAIRDKIGTVVDTTDMQKELETLRVQLRQVVATKNRLEQQMDSLPVEDVHHNRKILDLQRRYDEQYDIMGEVENCIDELEKQIHEMRQEEISSENVYDLLRTFDELYSELEDTEKRDLMRAIIERIDLYPERRADGCWVKNIVFNFPVPVNGVALKELTLENETTLDSVVLMTRK